jgi:hypothetical protein
MLFAPKDGDGGIKLKSKHIKNSVFRYEKEELSEENFWDDLANYLGVKSIPHDEYHGLHGRGKKIHAVDLFLS